MRLETPEQIHETVRKIIINDIWRAMHWGLMTHDEAVAEIKKQFNNKEEIK